MDQYAYLIVSACFFICLLVLLAARKDLRINGGAFFLLVAPAGIISEYWYLKDYWSPPTVLPDIFTGTGEDLLFAGSVMSLSIFIYPFLTKKRLENEHWLSTVPFFLMTFTLLVALQLLSLKTGLPTILTAILCNVCLGTLLIRKRPDLLRVGVHGALFMGIIAALIYIPLFGVFYPEYWETYWLMKEGTFGFYVLPGLPITEFLFYTSLGFFASVAYPFALQKQYVSI